MAMICSSGKKLTLHLWILPVVHRRGDRLLQLRLIITVNRLVSARRLDVSDEFEQKRGAARHAGVPGVSVPFNVWLKLVAGLGDFRPAGIREEDTHPSERRPAVIAYFPRCVWPAETISPAGC